MRPNPEQCSNCAHGNAAVARDLVAAKYHDRRNLMGRHSFDRYGGSGILDTAMKGISPLEGVSRALWSRRNWRHCG